MKTFLLVLLFSMNALATDLSAYLDQQLTMMDNGGSAALPVLASGDGDFFLRRFWLRVRPRAIFSLPGLVKIQVVPEIEMLWERPFPDGATGFKR